MTRLTTPSLLALCLLFAAACGGSGGGPLGGAPGDDDDSTDDDDAGDDDDATAAQVDCGPVLELPDGAAGGYYTAGEGAAVLQSQEPGAGSWDGCEVERTHDDGELVCEVLYSVSGTIVRANTRFTIFELEFELDEEESTCNGRSYGIFYRAQFADGGDMRLWAAQDFRGEDTAWNEILRSRFSEVGDRMVFDYTTEFEVTQLAPEDEK
jgi:hypothetical protein